MGSFQRGEVQSPRLTKRDESTKGDVNVCGAPILLAAVSVGKGRGYGHPIATTNHPRALADSRTSSVSTSSQPFMAATHRLASASVAPWESTIQSYSPLLGILRVPRRNLVATEGRRVPCHPQPIASHHGAARQSLRDPSNGAGPEVRQLLGRLKEPHPILAVLL